MTNVKTWVVINDIQIPFHDPKALNLVTSFVGDLKPHGVVMNGDIVDCYAISDFTRDPTKHSTLDTEVEGVGKLMGKLAKSTTKRVWIQGNHEDRMRRFTWKKLPELANHPNLSFKSIFHLDDYGFTSMDYGDFLMLGKLMVTHGSLVSKHSGQSAKAHFEKYGTSVLVGHTHRLGIYYRTDVRGPHAAYENGCLCRLDGLGYTTHPNWQQGFSVVHVDGNGNFNVQQIPILAGPKFFYGGEIIK